MQICAKNLTIHYVSCGGVLVHTFIGITQNIFVYIHVYIYIHDLKTHAENSNNKIQKSLNIINFHFIYLESVLNMSQVQTSIWHFSQDMLSCGFHGFVYSKENMITKKILINPNG